MEYKKMIATPMQSLNYRLNCDCQFSKHRRIIYKEMLFTGLLFILFISLLLTIPIKAAMVWSDNFDDGNLDGWIQSGCTRAWETYGTKYVKGNATAVNKNLQATGKWVSGTFTRITHPTIVTTGTWSFDIYFPEKAVNVIYCTVDFNDQPTFKNETRFDWNGYTIWLNEEGTYGMGRDTAPNNIINPENEQFGKDHRGTLGYHLVGWKHVDITRESNGRWRVYLNETLIQNVTDNKILSFQYFGISLSPGPIYDNVVVSDTIYVPPGSLRVTVKDSGGNALSGAAVSSTKQPSGQIALSGTTAVDGTVTFSGLTVGNYTLQTSKSGYVSGTSQGSVASGAKTELNATLQAQPQSGIPGFPIESVIIGVLLCTVWYWMYARRTRLRARPFSQRATMALLARAGEV